MIKKGLSSSIYNYLMGQYQRTVTCLGRRGWDKDLGDMSDDIWQSILEQVPSVSVSPQQSLSQLFIIHSVYRTPLKLF